MYIISYTYLRFFKYTFTIGKSTIPWDSLQAKQFPSPPRSWCGELEVYLVVPWKRRTCVQQSAEDFKEKTGGALEARETDIRWVSKRGKDLIQFGDEFFLESCGLKLVTLSFI